MYCLCTWFHLFLYNEPVFPTLSAKESILSSMMMMPHLLHISWSNLTCTHILIYIISHTWVRFSVGLLVTLAYGLITAILWYVLVSGRASWPLSSFYMLIGNFETFFSVHTYIYVNLLKLQKILMDFFFSSRILLGIALNV